MIAGTTCAKETLKGVGKQTIWIYEQILCARSLLNDFFFRDIVVTKIASWLCIYLLWTLQKRSVYFSRVRIFIPSSKMRGIQRGSLTNNDKKFMNFGLRTSLAAAIPCEIRGITAHHFDAAKRASSCVRHACVRLETDATPSVPLSGETTLILAL